MSPAADEEPRGGEPDFLDSLSHLSLSGVSASTRTVLVAFGANVLVGIAKSIAAVETGSASLLAEAAAEEEVLEHSAVPVTERQS